MLDLTDLTFNIPIRYDTDDRVLIFKAVLSYIARNINTYVIICESDRVPRFQELSRQIPRCLYLFEQTNDDIFHRTKLLNKMALHSPTKYIVNYDVDCVLHLPKYLEAITLLRGGEADFVTGFDSYTWNVPRQYHQRMVDTLHIDWLNTSLCRCANTVDIAKGGIVYWNKQKFIDIGLENEHFVSWGPEDQERVIRGEKLGLKYKRVSGPLYHLEHRRLLNSGPTHSFIEQNDREFEKIKTMTEQELLDYIKTWDWVPK